MEVNIITFGQLRDLLGDNFILQDIEDTNSLSDKLKEKFPKLSGMKYVIAVNKKIVNENISLDKDCVVALLPPFSGG